jgi:hypothetical protein
MTRVPLLHVLVLAGCVAHVPRTEVMVVVDAEPSVAARAQSVHVTVLGGPRGTTLTSQADQVLGGTTRPLHWPVTIALAPATNDSDRVFAVVAVASDSTGAALGTVRARSSWIPGRTLALPLLLEACCETIASTCSSDQTCRSCACVSSDVPPTSLSDWTSTDAGGSSDGAVASDGLDAGPPIDASSAQDAPTASDSGTCALGTPQHGWCLSVTVPNGTTPGWMVCQQMGGILLEWRSIAEERDWETYVRSQPTLSAHFGAAVGLGRSSTTGPWHWSSDGSDATGQVEWSSMPNLYYAAGLCDGGACELFGSAAATNAFCVTPPH